MKSENLETSQDDSILSYNNFICSKLVPSMSVSAESRKIEGERRVKLSILERMYNASDKRLFQRLNGEHPAAEGDHVHDWMFQFVDIIYVGTVFNVSGFIERCEPKVSGSDLHHMYSLLAVSFSILVIMFYTRAAFDSYVCISKAGGIIHVAVFCLYASAVFVMSLNIAEKRVSELEEGDLGFGECVAQSAYLEAFACAFAASRVVLIIMYLLYLKVFHESNVTGTFADELPPVTRVTLAEVKRASAKRSLTESHVRDRFSESSANEYLKSAKLNVVTEHFSRIYRCKVFPLAISAIIMLALVFCKQSPGVIFPTVAAVEVLMDFIPSIYMKGTEDWKKYISHRHFAQDRLGLFFLLVLGEAMLGFHTFFYNRHRTSDPSYEVIMYVNIISFDIFTV